MDLTTANLIASVTPERYENDVNTNAPITVTFLRDMDSTTFTDATVALQVVGTVLRVPISYTYSQRFLTITPTSALSPLTSYQVILVGDVNPQSDLLTNHISGIKDILGNGFTGVFSWVFTTNTVGAPAVPQLLAPIDQTAITTQPTFSFTAVTPASGATIQYEIQVATTNTFETLFWPQTSDTYNQTATSVTPGRAFDWNQEYWWRVRAVNVVGSSRTPGAWSTLATFYYGDPSLGVVTPDDQPLGTLGVTPEPLAVVSANPLPGTAGLQPTQYPTAITAVLNQVLDTSTLSNANFYVTSQAIDGRVISGTAQGINFSPSLNGSVYGSGGIIVEGAADRYKSILISGPLNSTLQAATAAGQTTLTLPVSAGYIQDNNKYLVTLDLPQLAAPLQWTFTSRYWPAFAGIAGVRSETDHFMPEADDDEIWMHIRNNSLYAIFIQVYWPTKVDAQSQIYQPPVSFNVNDPPYQAVEFVRLKTAADLLEHKFHSLFTSPRAQLGDFMVDNQNAALYNNLKLAISDLQQEYKVFEDALRGHFNRGYARGQAAQRGSMPFWHSGIDTFNFPYSTGYPPRKRKF